MHDTNQTKPEGMDRRGFLKAGLGTTAAVAFASGAHAAIPENKKITAKGKIPERKFGKTGHNLPVLGHGGSAMVQRFIRMYGLELTPEEERIEMVRHGYDVGMRYFDTARVYGESERIFGKALADVRDNCYIATKVAVFNPKDVRSSVETSLSELGMDYVDCMQVHSPSIERLGADGAMKIHEELVKLKDEGMLRFIGLTTHVVFEDVYKMISTGGFDQVLLARGYFRKGMDTLLSNPNIEWRERCVAKAHELGMGIVAMKVMGAEILGHNAKAIVPDFEKEKRAKLPAAAIRWALSDPRISVLNIGPSFKSDIEENYKTVTGDLKLTSADLDLLAEFSHRAYESEYVGAMKTV